MVRDLDRAIRTWTDGFGVGPFFVIDRVPLTEFTYEGADRGIPHVAVALSFSGGLQVELISIHDRTPSMWKAFLDGGGEGLHHVAYWTRDYARDLQRLTDRGMSVGHAGCGTPGTGGRFAYLSPSAGGAEVVELSEVDDAKRELFELVARVATGWDGQDPVRTFGHLQPGRANGAKRKQTAGLDPAATDSRNESSEDQNE